MTTPAETVPKPGAIRVLWPVMLVRTVVAAGVLVATMSVLPGVIDRSQRTLVNQRTGDVIAPVPELKSIGLVAGIVGGLVALAILVGWLYAGRRAVAGVRWGAVGVAVLSGLAIVSVGFTAVLGSVLDRLPSFSYAYELPGWVLAVSAVQVVVDLAVIVLLVVPSSRRWFAALNAPRPAAPTWPSPGH